MKKVLKRFIPPIFSDLYQYSKKLFKNNKKAKDTYYSTIVNHKKSTDRIIILGNGPSLKQQLETSIEVFETNTCACVNCFAITDFYTKIKPKVYILIDPACFVTCNNQETNEKNLAIFKNLLLKTTWNIDLVVGSQYKNNERLLSLKENLYINILFVNQNNCNTFQTRNEQFCLFNNNRISVPAQTVLNTAVYLSIFWKYKEIILVGADTSWHEELRIDQNSNLLYFLDEHFYGTKKRIIYSDTECRIPGKLHQEFYAIANALESYWLLKEYAQYNSVAIYNASEKSYIDAFDRKPLSDFVVKS